MAGVEVEEARLEAGRREAEAGRLEGQLAAALREEAEARRGLAALEPRRREISVAVVGGDSQAQEQLRALAHERAELEMSLAASRDAQDQLTRMLEEARARASEAREELRWLAELEPMGRERRVLEQRAEAEAAALAATLEELLGFDQRHRRALRPGGWNVFEAPPPLEQELAKWLRGRLGAVLKGFDELRDPGKGAPLPERDPLTAAKEGEEDRRWVGPAASSSGG